MPRGGKRPGAGRPKGSKEQHTLDREEARRYLSERVRKEIDPLATAQIESAKGLFVMFAKTEAGPVRVTDPDLMQRCIESGEGTYYIAAKDPDQKALKDIFDREFGRPTEHVALIGADGGPVRVQFVDV